MITNSKKEFFEQLKYELNRIGIDQTEEIFEDFEEHFADSALGGESEEETARNLGDVAEIARNYLNLESCRLNSMVERDIEHKKRVSLTKPGKSVPADLNLMDANQIRNTDCVREYTPEHISEEVYPNSNRVSSSENNSTDNSSNAASSTTNSANSANTENAQNSASFQNTSTNNNTGTTQNNSNSGNFDNGNIADAFSAAGKAVADAAKVTGKAIADAFEQSKVKDAVIDAGKSAAEAVKTAGQSVADAAKKAKYDYEKTKAENVARNEDAVPHPSDSFRENTNDSRKGEMPHQYKKADPKHSGFKFEDVKGLKPNVNPRKLVTAILLDLFLWSWLVPLITACIIALVASGAAVAFNCGYEGMWLGDYAQFVWLSRLIGGVAFTSLGIVIALIGIALLKPLAYLIRHIIVLHIKAVYDL